MSTSTTTTSTTSAETTGSTGTAPMRGEWEGIVHDAVEGGTTFTACNFELDSVCLGGNIDSISGCDNIFVRVSGTLKEGAGGFIGGTCDWDIDVDMVLEARACEPGDCGGQPSCGEGFCSALICDPLQQDCARGERCFVWSNGTDIKPAGSSCVPIADDAKAEGDPCNMGEGSPDDPDDCGLGLRCWSQDPDDTNGSCVAICDPSDPQACADSCVPCDGGQWYGLCVCDGCGVDGFC